MLRLQAIKNVEIKGQVDMTEYLNKFGQPDQQLVNEEGIAMPEEALEFKQEPVASASQPTHLLDMLMSDESTSDSESNGFSDSSSDEEEEEHEDMSSVHEVSKSETQQLTEDIYSESNQGETEVLEAPSQVDQSYAEVSRDL